MNEERRKELLLKYLEEEEYDDIESLKKLPSIAAINEMLYYTMEDERLFYAGLTFKDVKEILDEQYNAETLDSCHCFMLYDAANIGDTAHTYERKEELLERFKEAATYVYSVLMKQASDDDPESMPIEWCGNEYNHDSYRVTMLNKEEVVVQIESIALDAGGFEAIAKALIEQEEQ